MARRSQLDLFGRPAESGEAGTPALAAPEAKRGTARNRARDRVQQPSRESAGESSPQVAQEAVPPSAREAARETAREAAREAVREAVRETARAQAWELAQEAPPAELPSPRIFSVGELARCIRGALEGEIGSVHVRGEISNLRRPTSGHLYFCLKDEGAQLRAVLFRAQARLLRFRPEDGQEVIARGRVTFYEAGGDAQIVCDGLEPVGAGALALAFEQLKTRLAAEGLFDPARKKPLPFLPLRIGVVTSPTGAAIRDFLHVLHRRFPRIQVLIAPSRVQGEGAAEEIAAGIRRLDQGQVDVIVVTRGGGSIEDLWAFNEEVVARAIAAARTPVVSAVGHEIDFTIADFVADVRAPTPTAAAEILAPVEAELRERLAIQRARMQRALLRALERRHALLDRLRGRLSDPRHRLSRERLALDGRRQRAIEAIARRAKLLHRELSTRMRRLEQLSPAARLEKQRRRWYELRQRLLRAGAEIGRGQRAEFSRLVERLRRAGLRLTAEHRREFGTLAARLGALSPLGVLSRGYAIAFTEDGRVLRSASEVSPGTRLHLELGQGALEVRVVGPATPRKPGDGEPPAGGTRGETPGLAERNAGRRGGESA